MSKKDTRLPKWRGSDTALEKIIYDICVRDSEVTFINDHSADWNRDSIAYPRARVKEALAILAKQGLLVDTHMDGPSPLFYRYRLSTPVEIAKWKLNK